MIEKQEERDERIDGICDELGLRPYQRLNSTQVCEILGISAPTLNRIRANGSISYLRIGERGIGFFGMQIAAYMLSKIVETTPCPDTSHPKNATESGTTGYQSSPEAPHGAEHGTTKNLSRLNDQASARRILKRRNKN